MNFNVKPIGQLSETEMLETANTVAPFWNLEPEALVEQCEYIICCGQNAADTTTMREIAMDLAPQAQVQVRGAHEITAPEMTLKVRGAMNKVIDRQSQLIAVLTRHLDVTNFTPNIVKSIGEATVKCAEALEHFKKVIETENELCPENTHF